MNIKSIDEIKDEYAKSVKYDNWLSLFNNCFEWNARKELDNHMNEVNQLVQTEQKKKIVSTSFLGKTSTAIERVILNTENIK